MNSGYQKKHPSQPPRKGRLSFLLNHDEDDVRLPQSPYRFPQEQSVRKEAGERPQRSDNLNKGSQNAVLPPQTDPKYFQTARISDTGRQAQGPVQTSLQQGTENRVSDKRGVRKKRQRKFVCDTCGFGFYTNSDLQKHVSSVHLLLRPYKCTVCDKRFGERSNATKHFKSVHEKQKNAACDQCDKVFGFRDGLVRHVRLVHENVRNFHCQYPGCGQSFKQSAHLKKHELVHTRARPTRRLNNGWGNYEASSSARK